MPRPAASPAARGTSCWARQYGSSRSTARPRTGAPSGPVCAQAAATPTAATAGAARRALATIERNALAQVQLVNDLLDVSSIVLGTLRIELHPVHLVAIVDGEVRAACAEAERAGLTLDCDLPQMLPPVAGDAGRLHQVVRNLLSNAI